MSPHRNDPRRAGHATRAKVSGPTSTHGSTDPLPDTPLPAFEAAEAAYLGALILNPEARLEIDHLVGPDDFVREAHRQVFVAIRHLHSTGLPVDVVTVSDRLAITGHLDECGGPVALCDLTDMQVCPSPESFATYMTIVAREARRRRGIALLRKAIARLEAGEDPGQVASELAVAV